MGEAQARKQDADLRELRRARASSGRSEGAGDPGLAMAEVPDMVDREILPGEVSELRNADRTGESDDWQSTVQKGL